MSKLKAFLYIFYKSLTSPKYYADVVKTHLSLSMKYFFTLTLLASIGASIYVTVPLVPKVQSAIKQGTTMVLDTFEDDLVITVKEGELSINKPEPYIIPLPEKASTDLEGVPESLIVFDSDGTLDDFENTYDTLVLVNSVNMLMKDDTGIRVESLKQLPDGQLTKADLREVAAAVEPLTKYVPFVLGVFVFIGIAFSYMVFNLVHLLFVALILFLIGKSRRMQLVFSDYYQIAIHTFTLPFILQLFANAFKVDVPFASWFLVTNLAFAFLMMLKMGTSAEVSE